MNYRTLLRGMLSTTQLSIIGALLLTGCTTGTPEPLPIDSPLPQIEKLIPCKSKLAAGEHCHFIVQPELLYNHTGLYIKNGESYQIDVLPNQFWFDRNRHTAAPEGDDGSTFTQNLRWLKRNPQHKWFALMATGGNDDEQAINIAKQPI